MRTCDVLIVGGGPAGSSCAWKLRQAGLDVVVLDKATFPRDKVCAGWITPQVIDDLNLDAQDYRQGRTLQPITGFRVGLIGRDAVVDIHYAGPVSYGIRRCEFDEYLLRRSGACLRLGESVSTVRSAGGRWVINESITASVLVGAAGHFCPVRRLMNGAGRAAPVVAAQEAEFRIDRAEGDYAVHPERPELYFCADLGGYGWCFRKQHYINVGFGRIDGRAVPHACAGFVDFLKRMRRVPPNASWRWRGHAYALSGSPHPHLVDDGVVLIGDSAGLAYPESGEGIRPAIESGLLAASAIADCKGQYTRDRLEVYCRRIQNRFNAGSRVGRWASRLVPRAMTERAAVRCLKSPWFVRHLVLDRWFLHAQEASLTAGLAVGARSQLSDSVRATRTPHEEGRR
jgi:menaquinone-9 beta-reductase